MADTSNPSLTRLLALSLLTTQAAAHGYIQGIVAEDIFYEGYRPSFQYLSTPPAVPGWSDPENLSNGYIKDYSSPDIICHVDATPGQAYATVAAGDNITLQWTPWPTGHLGPVLTYLANCNGECTTVEKTSLLFNKIDAAGLITPGHDSSDQVWASSELVANNNSWTLTIPSSIAPGNYVLRNEIIALQEAMALGGAQNYPQCVNIKVTGSGTDGLSSGTVGTQLYTASDPGLHIDIYQSLSSYPIPGPPLLGGVVGNGTAQPGLNATSTALYPNVTASTSKAGFFNVSSTVSALSTSASVFQTTSSSALLSSTTIAAADILGLYTPESSSATTTTTPYYYAGVTATLTESATPTASAGAFYAAPTTFDTFTRSANSSSTPWTWTAQNATSTWNTTNTPTPATITIPGYGATLTITVTEPGLFATGVAGVAELNTTLPWGTAIGTGYAYASGTGVSSIIASPSDTGFIGVAVPVDNGFDSRRRSARQSLRERRRSA